MNIMEKIKNIINNDKVGQAFYNLFDRWQDEQEYEDINEYGKAIHNTIMRQYPEYDVRLVKTTKEPFGVVIEVDDKKVHIYVELKNLYLYIKAKLI